MLRPSQLLVGCEGGTEILRPSKLNSQNNDNSINATDVKTVFVSNQSRMTHPIFIVLHEQGVKSSPISS